MIKYLLVVAVGLFPFLSSAATYHYVTSAGVTASVEASSAQEALVTAPNIAANSGVAIDRGLIEPGMVVVSAMGEGEVAGANDSQFGTGGSNTFYYVTNAGVTASVQASNSDTALVIAPNRAVNSGVAIDDGTIESGMTVQSVAD